MKDPAIDRPTSSVAPLLREIVELVLRERGFDVAGCCAAFVEGRVASRLAAAGACGYGEYLRLLQTSPAELDLLVEALTLTVSSFFRDPIAFEYLNESVLPAILRDKAASSDHAVRIWSAGCAGGEEPYSVAILLHELTTLTKREKHALEVTVFATDIDRRALNRGQEGLYPATSLANVRHGLLACSFTQEGQLFRVLPAIARRVSFSVHDMLDQRTAAPAESVFGTFDLVLCRNLLIYFEPEYQTRIIKKLYRSLAAGGYLLLGQSETMSEAWQDRLQLVTDCCRLYRRPSPKRNAP